MRRRELREHIFKLLFMTQFNSQDEMGEQVQLYFEGLAEGEEKDLEYIREKYNHVLEHLEDIDRQLNETSHGWKTKRMRSSMTRMFLQGLPLMRQWNWPSALAGKPQVLL